MHGHISLAKAGELNMIPVLGIGWLVLWVLLYLLARKTDRSKI